ncbi:MAG: transcriptional regulator [Bacteroidota bacterium]|nr:transcriptional regulator [Bacteroidota bacterium]MEC8829952.1 transcriptional regulator [Bacteroidota bacterium]
MIVSIVYNIKMGVKKGYETHFGRALKITWGVFNIAWIAIVVMSILVKKDSSDFNYLKKMTNSTRGNLSIQL